MEKGTVLSLPRHTPLLTLTLARYGTTACRAEEYSLTLEVTALACSEPLRESQCAFPLVTTTSHKSKRLFEDRLPRGVLGEFWGQNIDWLTLFFTAQDSMYGSYGPCCRRWHSLSRYTTRQPPRADFTSLSMIRILSPEFPIPTASANIAILQQ
jgi:hypothetical protein